MSWSTVIKYIQALPDNVELSEDKKTVSIKVDEAESQPIILSVEQAHNLMVNASKSEPSPEVVDFLNCYLKENASDQLYNKDEGLNLLDGLSDKMKGLNVKVEIPKSLDDVLMAATNGTYKPSPTMVESKHKISVTFQISPKPGDSVSYTATGYDATKHIPFLKYNHADQFSIKYTMTELNETVFDGEVTDAQALLALVVVLQCQPKSWRKMIWDAWLAVTIQLHLLEKDKEVFPCQWMKQMFYADSLVKLKDVKCLLLGQDPVSKPNYITDLTDLRKATGIAFHAVGNDNPSLKGMKELYEINCDDDHPIDHCKNGRLLVNMIRTIGINDYSVSNNSCRGAWIAYTLKLANYFSKRGKPVIVFCKFPAALPEMYMPTACVDLNLTRVPHPAYVDANDDKDDIEKVKDILSNL